ncbi:MAG: hypothetical protein ACYDA5_05450 [Vulcanimicrobiaceae bacterium]
MRRKLRLATIVAGAALAVYVVVGVIFAGGGAPPPIPGPQHIHLVGGHVVGNRISTRRWSFDYRSAQLSPDGTTGTINHIRNGIIFKHGKPYLKISAEHISLNTNTLNFTATGRVHVQRIGKKGTIRSFDTDLVVWTNGAKLLELDHPSYVRTGHQVLRVARITVNFATDSIHFRAISGKVHIGK